MRQLGNGPKKEDVDGQGADEEEEDDDEDEYGSKLEDAIIEYLCEKIVAMREQPFIDAVDNLRRAQELNNLQMIMDMQKNKQKLSNNLNYHTANLGAGLGVGTASQMSGHTPVEGMSQAQYQKILMSQYQEVQDAYSVGDGKVLSQNKVTFKSKGAEADESQHAGSMGSIAQSREQSRQTKGKKGQKAKADDAEMN